MTDVYDLVREELSDSLTDRGIKQWVHACNRYLKGETPYAVFERGMGDLVLEAAVAFSEGVYL